MSDQTTTAFERRLVVALNAYADDAGPVPDPFARAREIARAHPRRRWLPAALPVSVRPAWLVAALLLGTLLAGFLIAGGRQPTTAPVIPAASPVIPAALYGRWGVGEAGDPYVDLNSEKLMGSPSGQAADLGRVIGFAPDSTGSIDGVVEIDGAAGCAPGRYHVRSHRLGSGEPGGPTPAGPDTGPVILDAIRFTEPEDACARRMDTLTAGPWQRVTHRLVPGQAVDSLDFTEPFELSVPVTFTLPDGALGGLSQDQAPTRLRIGHGYWNGSFLDDEPVYREVCDPIAGTLPDVPSDLEAVRAWMGAMTPHMPAPSDVIVDGRTALRWKSDGTCGEDYPAIADGVYGEVIYTIPTGDDMVVWAFRFDTEDEEAIGDAIATGLHFK
jgi:hypothetical protein